MIFAPYLFYFMHINLHISILPSLQHLTSETTFKIFSTIPRMTNISPMNICLMVVRDLISTGIKSSSLSILTPDFTMINIYPQLIGGGESFLNNHWSTVIGWSSFLTPLQQKRSLITVFVMLLVN